MKAENSQPPIEMTDNKVIAYFVSPHGFGHASRAVAVMEAMHKVDSTLRFEIFTKVPKWFFNDSLSGAFEYQPLMTDIGFVQRTPLHEDLPKTVQQLDDFLPFNLSNIQELAELLKGFGCRLVICDIAPMGIEVARQAGIPSLLVENFTWDWIYEGYIKHDQRIGRHILYLKELFEAADFHIQAEPVSCRRRSNLTTNPVSRQIRNRAYDIRKKLRIPEGSKVILITMGGIQEEYRFFEQLTQRPDICFLIPGADNQTTIRNNLVLLPHHSDYFHPDLVNASDAVIGKAGYSTVAEIYYAGVPFGFISRGRFPESQSLISFIGDQMHGLPIEEDVFYDGRWLSYLHELLAFPRITRRVTRGSEQVARFVLDLLI
jgi:uncharacterized protein (TIGR00661 family)